MRNKIKLEIKLKPFFFVLPLVITIINNRKKFLFYSIESFFSSYPIFFPSIRLCDGQEKFFLFSFQNHCFRRIDLIKCSTFALRYETRYGLYIIIFSWRFFFHLHFSLQSIMMVRDARGYVVWYIYKRSSSCCMVRDV